MISKSNETAGKLLKTDNALTYIHWTSFNNCSSKWYSFERRTEAERVWESPWGCSNFAYTTVLRLVCTHNCRRYYALALKTPFNTQNTTWIPQGYKTKQRGKNSRLKQHRQKRQRDKRNRFRDSTGGGRGLHGKSCVRAINQSIWHKFSKTEINVTFTKSLKKQDTIR